MAKRYATADEVIAMFPQFAATPSGVVALVLECAEDCIGLQWYGEKASRAHMLMSAHMLWLHPSAGPTGAGGSLSTYGSGQAVTSMSDGPASISWAPPTGGEDARSGWLASSPPGKLLAALDASMGSPVGLLARDHPSPCPFGGGYGAG